MSNNAVYAIGISIWAVIFFFLFINGYFKTVLGILLFPAIIFVIVMVLFIPAFIKKST